MKLLNQAQVCPQWPAAIDSGNNGNITDYPCFKKTKTPPRRLIEHGVVGEEEGFYRA